MTDSTGRFQVGDWVKIETPEWGILTGKVIRITVGKRAHLHIHSDADGRTYGVSEAAFTLMDLRKQTQSQAPSYDQAQGSNL